MSHSADDHWHDDIDRTRATLRFLESVIRCGEPFTEDVEEVLRKAYLRLSHMDEIVEDER